MSTTSSRRGALALAVAGLLAGSTLLAPVGTPGGPTAAAAATGQVFSYTGAPQLYVVPAGVTSIDVELRGAQGGTVGDGVGGTGAVVQATLAVTPGESLQIDVGGTGGWNGGGSGVASGGGASDIRRPGFSTSASCAFDLGCDLGQRAVVAGGGGGGSSFTWNGEVYSVAGGDADAVAGAGSYVNWAAATTGNFTQGGQGGGAGAGGAPGDGTGSTQGPSGGGPGYGGTSGYGQGGIAGGGGGGGWFGGGAGGQGADASSVPNGLAGGGAGSSWTDGTGVSAAQVSGGHTGDGTVTVSVPSAIGDAAVGFTGTAQTYTVPVDVEELYVKLYGGAGGASGDTVWGRLPVQPGQVLQLDIGGRGTSTVDGDGVFVGGWNGGGDSTPGWGGSGSSGGGASDVRVCATAAATGCTLADRVVVAGGGGGHYVAEWGLWGGNGGGQANGDGGGGNNPGHLTFPAGGGTQTAGGAGSADGQGADPTADGAFGLGGDSVSGGGGGGGYYGGGGGRNTGAGGGSSYASVTGAGGPSVLGTSGARFWHARGGGDGVGLAVLVGMPQAETGTRVVRSYDSATVAGRVDPRYLATTPTVFYGTDADQVAANTSVSVAVTAADGSATLAGTGMQPVSGTLTGLYAGTWYVTVCSQSVAGYACGAVEQLVVPEVGSPLWVDQDASGTVPVGTAFGYTFLASGDAPMTYTVNGTLPRGLVLDPATGVLSGTPTEVGTFTFTVTATNAVGTSTSGASTLVVGAAAPVVDTTALPDTTVGAAYTQQVSATGTGPLTFAVTSGALPAGLVLDPVTGVLTGTPTAPGTARFTIQVTGPGGTASRAFTLEVLAEGATLTLAATPGSTAAAGAPVTATASGLRPGTAWTLTVHSDPVVLASGTAPASGIVATTAPLPSLAAGTHEVTFTGTHVTGGAFTLRTWFRVDASGIITAVTDDAAVAAAWDAAVPVRSDDPLARTGASSAALGVVAALLLAGGGATLAAVRRRRRV